MVDGKIHKVGIYLRLSREDKKEEIDNKIESDSISNQRDLLIDYIKDNNMIFVDEYVDDGESGAMFDRDGFNQMIADIESKKINTVIVKDSSRLGRNHLEIGYYQEQYFPENQVRCICVTDGYDSVEEDSSAKDIMPFKNIMNEWYIKDISKKIKASQTTRRKNGLFIGGTAPYGYNKDPLNKNKLIIDEETAAIVKRIFEMFTNGIGASAIGRTLTLEKISIPSIHKNLNRGLKSANYGLWNTRTISDILKNPTYIGNLTQGKEKKVSYKSKKKIRIPKENWIIVEGACPAIIDKETFEMAQNIYRSNKNRYGNRQEQDILLKGLVMCKECGHTITFKKKTYQTQKKGEVTSCVGYCNYYIKNKAYNLCTMHKVHYYELEELILKEMRKMARMVKRNHLPNILKNNDKKEKTTRELETKLSKTKNELSLNIKKIDDIYLDKLNGLIDLEMFKRMYNKLAEDNTKRTHEIKEIETNLYNLKNKVVKINKNYNKIIDEFLEMKKPCIKLITSIIDKILVDEKGNLEIVYRIKPLESGY